MSQTGCWRCGPLWARFFGERKRVERMGQGPPVWNGVSLTMNMGLRYHPIAVRRGGPSIAHATSPNCQAHRCLP